MTNVFECAYGRVIVHGSIDRERLIEGVKRAHVLNMRSEVKKNAKSSERESGAPTPHQDAAA